MPPRSILLFASTAFVLAGCTETAVVQGPPPPAAPVYASEPAPPPPPPAPPAETGPTLTPLDQLCAPIALYPDPLVSLVLPASTFPDQISAAASYLQGGGDPSGVDQMPWDASVRGLSHYPTVVEWMGSNGDWTNQLGGAFASQPAAVMDAIQELRRKAQAVGTLTNTQQQQVVVYQNTVEIVPAQADVIYVPQYDPAVVYVQQPYGYGNAVFFGWSRPYYSGAWLSFGFDWHSHAVYTGNWYAYHQQYGWSRPVNYAQVSVNFNFSSRGWAPPPNHPPPPPQMAFRGGANVNVNVSVQARFAQPRPMAGAPTPPAQAVRVHTMVQNRPAPAARSGPSPQGVAQQPQSRPQPQGQPHPAPQAAPYRNEEQARTPAVQHPSAQPQLTQQQKDAQQKRQAQIKAQQQAQQRQQAATQQTQVRQTEAQRQQAAAQKAQQAKQAQQTKQQQQQHPQPQTKKPDPNDPKKQPPKKQAPQKKTPEEIERERKAQEGHPPEPS